MSTTHKVLHLDRRQVPWRHAAGFRRYGLWTLVLSTPLVGVELQARRPLGNGVAMAATIAVLAGYFVLAARRIRSTTLRAVADGRAQEITIDQRASAALWLFAGRFHLHAGNRCGKWFVTMATSGAIAAVAGVTVVASGAVLTDGALQATRAVIVLVDVVAVSTTSALAVIALIYRRGESRSLLAIMTQRQSRIPAGLPGGRWFVLVATPEVTSWRQAKQHRQGGPLAEDAALRPTVTTTEDLGPYLERPRGRAPHE